MKNKPNGWTRREFIRYGAGTAGALLYSASSFSKSPSGPTAKAGNRRPNIILMLADDMGYSDLGCYGSEIHTPHIDALARGGIRFGQFYNTARCCPTRASLLTGLYPHQAGIGHMTEDYGVPAFRGDLNRQCVTIAEALKLGGYTTLMTGKWHITPVNKSKHNWPLQRGFDRFFGTILGAGSYYDPVTLTRGNESIETPGGDFYYTTAIGENAVRFVDEYGGKENPFFMYVPFTSPHWPLHALEKDIAKYKGSYELGWDELRARRHKRMIEMGLVDERWGLTPRDERVPAWKDVEHKKWEARRMEVYAAQIDSMDQAVGQIMGKLRQLGIEQDTLILFLADNGGCAEVIQPTWTGMYLPKRTLDGRPVRLGNDPSVMPGPEENYQSYGIAWANASNTPFRLYKHWVHEGGIATPLIAYWPDGIKQANTITQQPGHLIDIMATCVDVAQIEYPSTYNGNAITPMEGKSLVRVFEGSRHEGHEPIYWEHEGNRAVRQGNWKLVSRYRRETGGTWELYDLERDRTEMNNLVEKHKDKVADLSGMYADWAERARIMPWKTLMDRLRS